MDSKRTNSCIEKTNLLQNKKRNSWLEEDCGVERLTRDWSGSLNRSGTMTCGWRGLLYSQNLVERSYGVVSTSCQAFSKKLFGCEIIRERKNLDALVDVTCAPSAMYTERVFCSMKTLLEELSQKRGFLKHRYFVEVIKRVKLEPLHKIVHLNRLV